MLCSQAKCIGMFVPDGGNLRPTVTVFFSLFSFLDKYVEELDVAEGLQNYFYHLFFLKWLTTSFISIH